MVLLVDCTESADWTANPSAVCTSKLSVDRTVAVVLSAVACPVDVAVVVDNPAAPFAPSTFGFGFCFSLFTDVDVDASGTTTTFAPWPGTGAGAGVTLDLLTSAPDLFLAPASALDRPFPTPTPTSTPTPSLGRFPRGGPTLKGIDIGIGMGAAGV